MTAHFSNLHQFNNWFDLEAFYGKQQLYCKYVCLYAGCWGVNQFEILPDKSLELQEQRLGLFLPRGLVSAAKRAASLPQLPVIRSIKNL